MQTQDLKTFVESSDLVSKKDLGNDLFLLKYKRKVFYKNLWNSHLEECRGTIIDKYYNVVSLPFKKIYNYGVEGRAPQLRGDTPVWTYKKVNGFMVAATSYKGELLVSTTGSIDSIFAERAKSLMSPRTKTDILKDPGYTYLFECVHVDDPHIIEEKPGLYFLGKREKRLGAPLLHPKLDYHVNGAINLKPFHGLKTVDQVIEESKVCDHEGFVFYTEDGKSAKIKSPYYLVKKFLARIKNTDVLLTPSAKNRVEEEYYPLIDHIVENLDEFTQLEEQERLVYIRKYLEEE